MDIAKMGRDYANVAINYIFERINAISNFIKYYTIFGHFPSECQPLQSLRKTVFCMSKP